MSRFSKYVWLWLGSIIIIGTLLFAVEAERSVPAGVDLGFEPYYFFALIVGGACIFASMKISVDKENKS